MRWLYNNLRGTDFSISLANFLNSDATKINDLLPYVESILWGCQKCNLTCVDPFNSFIIDSFGPDVHNALCVGSKVTSEVSFGHQHFIINS